MLRPLAAALCLALTTSCGTVRPTDFSSGTPNFDPIVYFTGKTESAGVRENRRGTPVEQVFTSTTGKMVDGTLEMKQDLRFVTPEKTTTSRRTWRMRKTGPHSYEASANDMVGSATGQSSGNSFHWNFPLQLKPGNPLTNIRMSQWMYLQPDGKTMMNHTTITKAGIVVGQVSEVFSKDR